MLLRYFISFFFFFNDTATTEIYTLSLHDALPISHWLRLRCLRIRAIASRFIDRASCGYLSQSGAPVRHASGRIASARRRNRSEEHTSELQSRLHLVCRLLLEKKKTR